MNKIHEAWARNGWTHREDGPAVISYWGNGKKSEEVWGYEGEFHRTNGPAIIEYDLHGNIVLEKYYINGERITKRELEKYNTINNLLNKVHGKKKVNL